jgi:hypothetical protein
MRHRLLNHRSLPAQAGASVIEFALVLLVFLTFFLGLIDLTRLLYTFHAAQEAARVGARYAAVCDDTTRSADVRTVMQRLVPAIASVSVEWSPSACTVNDCQSLKLRINGFEFKWISPIAGVDALAPLSLPVIAVTTPREAMRQDANSAALCAL